VYVPSRKHLKKEIIISEWRLFSPSAYLRKEFFARSRKVCTAKFSLLFFRTEMFLIDCSIAALSKDAATRQVKPPRDRCYFIFSTKIRYYPSVVLAVESCVYAYGSRIEELFSCGSKPVRHKVLICPDSIFRCHCRRAFAVIVSSQWHRRARKVTVAERQSRDHGHSRGVPSSYIRYRYSYNARQSELQNWRDENPLTTTTYMITYPALLEP